MRFDIEFSLKEQGTKITDIEKQLTKLSSTSISTQRNINNFSSSIKSMTTALLGYVAASKAFDIGTSLTQSIINTTASFEKYLNILGTLEGSQQKAAESFEYIKKFAKDTPFELDKVTEAFVKMRSYGLDTKGLKTYGDTAAALGKDLIQVIEAVADANVNQYERLLELGIKSANMGKQTIFAYTDASGKAKTIVTDNNKAMIESTLQAIFNSKYESAMSRLTQTFDGMYSNLKDNWSQLLDKIGTQSGVFDSIKNVINDLNKSFDNLAPDSTQIKAFGETIKGVIVGSITAFGYLSDFVLNFARGFNTLSIAAETAFNAIRVSFARLKLFMLEGLKAVATELSDTFSVLPDKYNKYIDAVANIQKAIDAEKINADKSTTDIIQQQNEAFEAFLDTEQKRLVTQKSITSVVDLVKQSFDNSKQSITDNTKVLTDNANTAQNTVKGITNVADSAILAKSKFGDLTQATKDLAKEQSMLRNTDLIEYFKIIGEGAKSAELNMYNTLGDLAEKGTLNPDQLTDIYKALSSEIVQIKASETKQKLDKDIAYYKSISNLEQAFAAESESIKQDLINKGYDSVKVEQMHAAQVAELSKEYKQLAFGLESVKQQDLGTYFKTIGQEAEAAKITMEQTLKELTIKGNLSDSQLTAIKQAQSAEIVRINASENEQKLAQDLNYYMTIKDFEQAKLTETQQIKEQLIEQGYEGVQLEQMHIAKVEELTDKYKQLHLQELESQKTVSAGFELYINGLNERLTNYKDLSQDIFMSIEQSLTSSFNTFFTKGEEGFMSLKELSRNVFKGILESIQQTITQMIAMQTMQAVLGGSLGGFGFGGMFAQGAAFSNGQVQAFATGGVVNSPTFFGMSNNKTGLMGEAGPEAIMPLQRDSSGNLGVSTTKPIININNYANANIVAKETENGYNIDIESIDRQLAERARAGRSEYDKINQRKYGLNKV